mgnify:CR=1 FL=1
MPALRASYCAVADCLLSHDAGASAYCVPSAAHQQHAGRHLQGAESPTTPPCLPCCAFAVNQQPLRHPSPASLADASASHVEPNVEQVPQAEQQAQLQRAAHAALLLRLLRGSRDNCTGREGRHGRTTAAAGGGGTGGLRSGASGCLTLTHDHLLPAVGLREAAQPPPCCGVPAQASGRKWAASAR